MLLMGAARWGGYEGHRHRFLASAVEIIHTATLLHDDVIDESTRRRGTITAHRRWSNKASILVGDFFLAKSFDLVVRYGNETILRILSDAAADIAEGESLQLVTADQLDLSQETYDHIIAAKTARLFSASLEMGACIADVADEQRLAWREYGMALGIFYQQVDDVMDYCGHHNDAKAVGEDFKQGRVTLPVMHAYGQGSVRERQLLEEAFARKSEEDWHSVRQLVRDLGSLRWAFDHAHQRYRQACRRSCAVLGDETNEWVQAILSVADFTYRRGRASLDGDSKDSLAA